MPTLVAEAEQPAAAPLWVVEAWRAVAALLVLWAHWGIPLGWPGAGPQGWLRFAFTGVDLFFVLSGFVFAPLLLQRPAPSVRAFALRRVSRIYPAYLVALALYVLLAWQAGRPLLFVTEHLLMGHLQSREMAFYYNPAFWSLPVEVAFYAALPLLAVWLARGRAAAGGEESGQGLRWLLLLGLALLMRLALLAGADGATQNLAYVLLNHLPGLLVEFLLGVWVWQRAQQPLSRAGAWAWGLAGLAGWCVLAAVFVQLPASVQAWPGGQLALGAALCFALMLRATLLLPSGGVVVQTLARWGGRLSYSVYLLHIAWLAPALAWSGHWGSGVGSVFALGALVASCLALHWAVEEPARRWGRLRASEWERAGRGGGSAARSRI
jgi:peptidoglycan/LPS O-acetylase OafA/YrhL